MLEEEKIKFVLFGLDLLEPMAFVTNLLIVSICIFSYLSTKNNRSNYAKYWRFFFLTFAIAAFCGGLSHVFWNYLWFYGKIPSWTTGVLSSTFAAFAMLEVSVLRPKAKTMWQWVIILKGIIVLGLAFANWKFLFIAIDTIVTFLGFCGAYGYYLWRIGYNYVRYVVIGVLIILPSAFIFLLKIDLHEWMNREDLSHLLMFVGIYYFGVSVLKQRGVDSNMSR